MVGLTEKPSGSADAVTIVDRRLFAPFTSRLLRLSVCRAARPRARARTVPPRATGPVATRMRTRAGAARRAPPPRRGAHIHSGQRRSAGEAGPRGARRSTGATVGCRSSIRAWIYYISCVLHTIYNSSLLDFAYSRRSSRHRCSPFQAHRHTHIRSTDNTGRALQAFRLR